MLTRLYIENFALVDKLEVSFEPGMNVLTGETGAGKSIIVGAVGRLLGEKTDSDDVRSGKNMALIEADFQIAGMSDIIDRLDRLEIEHDNKSITLRREISINKRSRSFINGQLVNLTQLKEISQYLAELFGQHSHQQLLDEKNHLFFLDSFAGLKNDVEKIGSLYEDWFETKKQLENLISRKELEKNSRELLLFQKDEIEKASVRSGEEEELLAEKKILDSSQTLGEKSESILQKLDRDENSALSLLNSCLKEMSQISSLDSSLQEKAELLDDAVINLEEFREQIESYLSTIPDDPARLDEINFRLDELYRLKKKYGGSEEAIIETLNQIDSQLSSNIDVDKRIEILDKKEMALREDYTSRAIDISKRRKKAADKLTKEIKKELAELGINSCLFECQFDYEEDNDGIRLEDRFVKPNRDGLETGRFMISPNPGEPLKPLARIASGGEISRIMLALKALDKTQLKNRQMLLLFDEIDAGIGGLTANAVAKKLSLLSNDFQLLVITHLHQIASVGNFHYAVTKIDSGSKRKIINVEKLSSKEKKIEIKRMLALT